MVNFISAPGGGSRHYSDPARRWLFGETRQTGASIPSLISGNRSGGLPKFSLAPCRSMLTEAVLASKPGSRVRGRPINATGDRVGGQGSGVRGQESASGWVNGLPLRRGAERRERQRPQRRPGSLGSKSAPRSPTPPPDS